MKVIMVVVVLFSLLTLPSCNTAEEQPLLQLRRVTAICAGRQRQIAVCFPEKADPIERSKATVCDCVQEGTKEWKFCVGTISSDRLPTTCLR